MDEYTEEIDGNIQWCKPSRQARYLGIDEFKLRFPHQTANKKTLEQRDNESREHNARLQEIKNSNTKAEFTAVNPERVQKTDSVARYKKIIEENERMLAIDIVKKKLTDAYETMLSHDSMHRVMSEIVDFYTVRERRTRTFVGLLSTSSPQENVRVQFN